MLPGISARHSIFARGPLMDIGPTLHISSRKYKDIGSICHGNGAVAINTSPPFYVFAERSISLFQIHHIYIEISYDKRLMIQTLNNFSWHFIYRIQQRWARDNEITAYFVLCYFFAWQDFFSCFFLVGRLLLKFIFFAKKFRPTFSFWVRLLADKVNYYYPSCNLTLYLIETPFNIFCKQSRPRSGSYCKSCLIRV